jgi:hypothetical protein
MLPGGRGGERADGERLARSHPSDGRCRAIRYGPSPRAPHEKKSISQPAECEIGRAVSSTTALGPDHEKGRKQQSTTCIMLAPPTSVNDSRPRKCVVRAVAVVDEADRFVRPLPAVTEAFVRLRVRGKVSSRSGDAQREITQRFHLEAA